MGSRQTPESSEVSSQLLTPKSDSCGGNSGIGTSGTAGELQVLSIKSKRRRDGSQRGSSREWLTLGQPVLQKGLQEESDVGSGWVPI